MFQPSCNRRTGDVLISEVVGGTQPYLYSLNGGEFSPAKSFENLDPGVYTLAVRDFFGCELTEVFEIFPREEFSMSLGNDLVIEFADSAQLIPTLDFPINDIDSILWSPEIGLSCTDCLMPFARPLNNEEYQLRIIRKDGCELADKIKVRVIFDPEVFVPNVFSPHNDDSNNDLVTVFAKGVQISQIQSFKIYNRWGAQIFERLNFEPNDVSLGWDGTFKGERMNPGVYVYFALVEFIDGSVELFKGDITLVE